MGRACEAAHQAAYTDGMGGDQDEAVLESESSWPVDEYEDVRNWMPTPSVERDEAGACTPPELDRTSTWHAESACRSRTPDVEATSFTQAWEAQSKVGVVHLLLYANGAPMTALPVQEAAPRRGHFHTGIMESVKWERFGVRVVPLGTAKASRAAGLPEPRKRALLAAHPSCWCEEGDMTRVDEACAYIAVSAAQDARIVPFTCLRVVVNIQATSALPYASLAKTDLETQPDLLAACTEGTHRWFRARTRHSTMRAHCWWMHGWW
ncbi:MAG: hypothetical protein EOO41_00275 [Methanobacteriota archaeon]|nr:MAG: hypothetical protein EOO41_00275 [Euryarchaeota archaeon]